MLFAFKQIAANIEKEEETACFAVSCTFFLLLFLSTTNASSIFRIDFRKFAIHSIDVLGILVHNFFVNSTIMQLSLTSHCSIFFFFSFSYPFYTYSLIFLQQYREGKYNSTIGNLWEKVKVAIWTSYWKGRYP